MNQAHRAFLYAKKSMPIPIIRYKPATAINQMDCIDPILRDRMVVSAESGKGSYISYMSERIG